MANADGLKRKTFVASLWSVLRSVWSAIITFVLFAVMARLLAPADFGVFALASIVVEIARIVATAGLGSAIVREPDRSASFDNTVFWCVLGLSLAAAGILALGAPAYARLVNAPEAVNVIRALAVLLPLTTLTTVPSALLTRDFQQRSLTFQSVVSGLAGGVVAVILAFQGWGVWALVGQAFVGGIVGLAMIWRMCPWRPALMFDRSRVRGLVIFSSSMMATQIVWLLLVRVQEIFISRWHGPEAVGQYRIAWRLIELISQSLLSPIGSVALVTFSHVQNDPGRFRAIYARMVGIAGLATFPALLGIGAVAPLLLPLLFGDKWDAAIPVAQVLVLMSVPFVLNFFSGPALTSVNRPQANLWIAVLQLALTVVFTWIAIPYGLVAVAAAYVARAWITMIPQQLALRRHAGIPMASTARVVLPALVSAAAMAVAVRFLMDFLVPRLGGGWETAVAGVVFGLILFPAIMFAIGHDPRREIRDLLTSLRQRKET